MKTPLLTKKQFVDCAVRAGLVPSAAVDDAESYDGGATLHQLSVMWTAVCELQQDEPGGKAPPDHEWDENGKCKWCPAVNREGSQK